MTSQAPPPNTADPMNLGYHTSSINSFIIAEDETQYPDSKFNSQESFASTDLLYLSSASKRY